DWLSSGWPVGHLQVIVQVTATGPQTLTATATSQQGVFSTSHSTLALSLTAPTTTTTTSGTPTGLNGSSGSTTGATQDVQKPTSRALASTGTPGRTVKLRFRIYDNRGTARAVATIKHAGKVMGAANTGFGPVSFGTTYYVGWHVPLRAAKG